MQVSANRAVVIISGLLTLLVLGGGAMAVGLRSGLIRFAATDDTVPAAMQPGVATTERVVPMPAEAPAPAPRPQFAVARDDDRRRDRHDDDEDDDRHERRSGQREAGDRLTDAVARTGRRAER